jgi:hypothetical protein
MLAIKMKAQSTSCITWYESGGMFLQAYKSGTLVKGAS